jgi:hypothetical protein
LVCTSCKVTVFDFSTILERTEKRVRDDLLGAGPKTVDELRSIAGRLRVKYQHQLERKIQRAKQQEEREKGEGTSISAIVPPPQIKGVMDKASNMAGGFFAKVKSTKFPTSFATRNESAYTATSTPEAAPTIVDLPPIDDTPAANAMPLPSVPPSEDWVGNDLKAATDAINNFSIGDEEEDADMLL